MSEKRGASGCDAGPVEANSKKLRAAYSAFASQSQPDLQAPPSDNRVVVGIDIGAAGALALVRDGELIEVADMPILHDGPKGRASVNAPLLAAIVRRWAPSQAFVEQIGPRPTDGHAAGFAFGRAKGCAEGVLATLGVPVQFLTVPSWRRLVGLPSNASKDQARSEAIRRWPDKAALFARVRDDGRAEAYLIAVAGLMREARK